VAVAAADLVAVVVAGVVLDMEDLAAGVVVLAPGVAVGVLDLEDLVSGLALVVTSLEDSLMVYAT